MDEKLQLLMLNGYSFPERIAFSQMELDLYKSFAKSGIKTDVITPTPTRGITKEEYIYYKERSEEQLEEGQVVLHRYKLNKEPKDVFRRAYRYLWGQVKAYSVAKKYKKSNVIFCNSTPPIQGLVCAKLKKHLQIPFVYYLCDVFPDSMLNNGMLSEKSFLYKIGRVIENKTYRSADLILTVSNDIRENILKKGVPEDKVKVVYNWIDTSQIVPVERKKNRLIEMFSLDPQKFYIVYAGNIGSAQGLEVLVESAKLIQEKKEIGKNIEFLIFGNGIEEKKIRSLITEYALTNMKVFPMLERDYLRDVYSLGDLGFVSCKKGFGKVGMPSKTWSIMGAAKPVLLCFDDNTELKNIVTMNECGFYVNAGDSKALAETIIECSKSSNLEVIGLNGRSYVEENMSISVCTKKIIDSLFETVGKKKES